MAFNPSEHLVNLGKGKGEYLEVKHRLVWLRSEHADADVVTEHVTITDDVAVFKATVSIPGGGSATGYGSETPRDFRDYIEKSETKAIGRALAALGYGTQFATELDDGTEPIADAPVTRPATPKQTPGQDAMSESQRKAILALFKTKGMDDDEVAPWLDSLVGKRQLDGLRYSEATRVIQALNKRESAQQPAQSAED